jgi:hypothetical protein
MKWNIHAFKPETSKDDASLETARKSEFAATRTVTFQGDGGPYTATMTCGPQGFTCEWSPHMPIKNGRGLLKKKELKRYQQVRNELAQETANHLGAGVLVLD